MAEKPIIFSGPMVRAILEGRKSQTRRVVKPQPTFIESSGRWRWPLPKKHSNGGKCPAVVTASREWYEYAPPGAFPYRVGDVLWVRETFANMEYECNEPVWTYRADTPSTDTPGWMLPPGVKWRPSIHMPRAAARLFLRVTGVRVERVTEITEDDACAEGARVIDGHWTHTEAFQHFHTPTESFGALWDSINAARGYPFESSPWVWVYEFEQREGAG